MVTVLKSMNEGGPHLSWASSPRGGGELGRGWHPGGVEGRLGSGCCKSISSSSFREKLKQDPRHLGPPTPVRTGNHLNIGPLGIGSASWVCLLHGEL